VKKNNEKENQTSEYSLIILVRKSELMRLNQMRPSLIRVTETRIYHKSWMGRKTVVVEITWDRVWRGWKAIL